MVAGVMWHMENGALACAAPANTHLNHYLPFGGLYGCICIRHEDVFRMGGNAKAFWVTRGYNT